MNRGSKWSSIATVLAAICRVRRVIDRRLEFVGQGSAIGLPDSIDSGKGLTMSQAAVVQFCQRIAKTPDLQLRLESGVKSGAGWELIVSVGQEHGFEFSAQDAAECFEQERRRRAARESTEHAETHILKHSPVLDMEMADTQIMKRGDANSPARAADALSLKGLRRVALSHDWNIELSATAAEEDESIFS